MARRADYITEQILHTMHKGTDGTIRETRIDSDDVEERLEELEDMLARMMMQHNEKRAQAKRASKEKRILN